MIISSCPISEAHPCKLGAPHWDFSGILPSQRSLMILSGWSKKTPEEEWSCEEVSNWDATIKAMTDDVGTFLVSIGDNGSILLDMYQDDLK